MFAVPRIVLFLFRTILHASRCSFETDHVYEFPYGDFLGWEIFFVFLYKEINFNFSFLFAHLYYIFQEVCTGEHDSASYCVKSFHCTHKLIIVNFGVWFVNRLFDPHTSPTALANPNPLLYLACGSVVKNNRTKNYLINLIVIPKREII